MGTHCQAAQFEGSRFSLLFKNTDFTMADTAETTTTVPEVPATEAETNGDKVETTTEATNGEAAEAATNGEEVKETETTNGDAEVTKEAANGEEVTEGEATKRKADTSDDAEEESAEKIAKLKEVAAEADRGRGETSCGTSNGSRGRGLSFLSPVVLPVQHICHMSRVVTCVTRLCLATKGRL